MFKVKTINHLAKTTRSPEWWDYKITSILGTVYATLYFNQFFPSGSIFFFMLAALVPCASYVSLINDWTDLEEDKLAGKENRLEGKSRGYALALIFACLSIGLIVSFFLSKLSLILYCCAWIVFSLYSLPPFRLKKRGILGVVADASGSHLFPQLFAVSALYDWYQKDVDLNWIGAVAVWSIASGLRGILWHQLKDKSNDLAAGVGTFVQRQGESLVQNLVKRLIFPAEILAFLLMLGYTGNQLAFIFLGIYIALELSRRALWGVDIVLVGPTERFRVFMEEYYGVFYPIAFLVSVVEFQPFSWIILILHLAFFFRRIWHLYVEIVSLARGFLSLAREFILGY